MFFHYFGEVVKAGGDGKGKEEEADDEAEVALRIILLENLS